MNDSQLLINNSVQFYGCLCFHLELNYHPLYQPPSIKHVIMSFCLSIGIYYERSKVSNQSHNIPLIFI